MKTLKKTVAATLVTLLFTGFALADKKAKGKRKGKARSRPAAVKIERGAAEIDPLTKSLGFDGKSLQLLAESLGAENGEALAKMGAKFLGDVLSTEEGRQASRALAENGAKLLGQMMSAKDGGELNIDLSQLLGEGAEPPKAFMFRHGRGGHDNNRFEWREHDESDHDDDEEGEEGEDEVIELLEELTEQMGRQNELLEEILERLEK